MKKFLLPEKGNFYKANLHSHTTFSDGALTPEQMKDLYKSHGYSIVAFTDHNVLIPHDELKDESFLPLHGIELNFAPEMNLAPSEKKMIRNRNITCHICFIGIKEDNVTQFCYHREKYFLGNGANYRHLIKYDTTQPDYVRDYTTECINEVIRIGRESGFFVTYNHPNWSLESYPQYMSYTGMHAMEIFNQSGYSVGYDEYVPHIYDDILRSGKRIFCIATDDNHNRDVDNPLRDMGGFVLIKAPNLEYETITTALLNGDFYSSTGPEIYELYIEDGAVHIKCSPAQRITYTTGVRRAGVVEAKDGKLVTEAEFKIDSLDIYFRLTVIAPDGKPANTNAYFIDEVLK